MDAEGSVTRLIEGVRVGDEAAVRGLWERYFPKLVALCQKRLRGHRQGADDAEDVALSAFDSFCRLAVNGRFPDLKDRDGLWRLLVVIAVRKGVNLLHHDRCQRRGGGRVVRESTVQTAPTEREAPGLEQIVVATSSARSCWNSRVAPSMKSVDAIQEV